MKRSFLILSSYFLIIGCASVNRGLSLFHYKGNLHPLGSDKRILIEPGVEKEGQAIADDLDSSISIVNSFFETPFLKPVYVTLCATEKSHIRHCGDYKNSRGMTNWGRIFIAPSAFTSHTQFSILTHELAHLHTCQRIGIFRFIGNIPAWFSEGIAVMVSNGAGAEEYTDSAGIEWIREGKCFSPVKKGNFLKTSGQNDVFLPFDMFYRQSELFIRYLMTKDPAAFHTLLGDLENGRDFDETFKKIYKHDPETELNAFKEAIAKR